MDRDFERVIRVENSSKKAHLARGDVNQEVNVPWVLPLLEEIRALHSRGSRDPLRLAEVDTLPYKGFSLAIKLHDQRSKFPRRQAHLARGDIDQEVNVPRVLPLLEEIRKLSHKVRLDPVARCQAC